MAANGRVVVPTAVRVEAGWRRRDHGAANANRLVGNDVPLTGPTRIELSSCDVWYRQRRWSTPRLRWLRSAWPLMSPVPSLRC